MRLASHPLTALAILLLVGCDSPATSAIDSSTGAPDFSTSAQQDLSTVADLFAIDLARADLAMTSSPDLASAAKIVFQCKGIAGGICLMNGDGSGRVELRATGRNPDRSAAGEILFHDDSYKLYKLGGATPLGDGAFGKWRKDGSILFQCTGLGGGICTMTASGANRSELRATGRAPDENAAGVILFHDDNYVVQKRDTGGGLTPLGDGAFPRWQADGTILFQCEGLGDGGLCRMNADGSNRVELRAAGRCPDGNVAGEVLFHDDNYVVQKRSTAGSLTPLGEGAFPRFAP